MKHIYEAHYDNGNGLLASYRLKSVDRVRRRMGKVCANVTFSKTRGK